MTRRCINRRQFLGATVAGATALALPRFSSARSKHPLLDQYISIDTHTHPGELWRTGGKSFTPRALSDIADSQLTAVVFSVPVDIPLMGESPRDIVREPSNGELYDYTFGQLNKARRLIETAGFMLIATPDDLKTVKAEGGHGAILGIEGGDFAEGNAGSIEEAYDLGVRVIQPGHFRSNIYTDLQTAEPRYDGLSAEGKEFIGELNRLGIVIDTAHMSMEAVQQASEISSTPLLSSHTLLLKKSQRRKRSRAIGASHARIIGKSGGAVGVWSYSNRKIPASLENFLNQYKELSSEIGVDHIVLGTDLNSGGFKTGWLDSYDKLPEFVDGLLGGGFSESEVGRIVGGNFIRILEDATAKKT